MKKLLTALLMTGLAWLPVPAEAANEDLATRLVKTLHSGEDTILKPPATDGPPRDDYYRQVAVDFYAARFDRVELQDLLGFFRAPAGSRLVRNRDRIEREVIAIAFSQALGSDALSLPETPSEGTDSRGALAAELMKSSYFAARIEKLALQYETASSKKTPKKADEASVELVRNLFIGRYSTRFSPKLLRELVEFYSTNLGKKFSKAQIELPEVVHESASKFGS